MKKKIFVLFIFCFPSLIFSNSFFKGDLVTLKDGKYILNMGIVLKSLNDNEYYNYDNKLSPETIKVNFSAEAKPANNFSKDKFIFLSSIIIYTNFVYFLDSVFYGYVDNNIFLSETDIKFSDKPFEHSDIIFQLFMDQEKYSLKIKSSILRIERNFSENWSDFFNREEKYKQKKLFIEERKKIIMQNELDLTKIKKYENEYYGFSINYPEKWNKEIPYNEYSDEEVELEKVIEFTNPNYDDYYYYTYDTLFNAKIEIFKVLKNDYDAQNIIEDIIYDNNKEYEKEDITFGKNKWIKYKINTNYKGKPNIIYLFLQNKKKPLIISFNFFGDFTDELMNNFVDKIVESVVFIKK